MNYKISLILLLITTFFMSCMNDIAIRSLSVESNEYFDKLAELDAPEKISDIVVDEDKNISYLISISDKSNTMPQTKMTTIENPDIKSYLSTFTISEIEDNNIVTIGSISSLEDENYFHSYVKDNKLYLFSCLTTNNSHVPFSVFLRIFDLGSKQLISEKVLFRKYLEEISYFIESENILSYTPSIKVSPNKEYFAIYINHYYQRIMSVWDVNIFDKNANRIETKQIDRFGTIDFSIDDNGSIWITGMKYKNYAHYFQVEHLKGNNYMGDYIKMPLVDHQDKTNIDMLKTVNPDNYVNGERKYGNAYYPTNQKQIFHENKALFFNYIFCYNGNGGIAISEFDKKSGKIDNIKLIPYHVIFDSTKSLNNEFRCKYVPELDITNLIEHNGNYYLVLENFSTQFLVTEYRSYYLGYSGNKYIVALDSNFNVKWADAYNLWHRFIMRGGNYTDSYRMQGSSQFYIKDDKLEGHIVIQPDQEQFNYVDMGFFKVSYDLETGKSEKKLITTVDKSRKVFYNSLYPVGNGSVLLDQNYQDELYLIKEK